MTSDQPGGQTTLDVLIHIVEYCQCRNENGFYANVTDREQNWESGKIHQTRTTQRILVRLMVSVGVVVEIKGAEKGATSW